MALPEKSGFFENGSRKGAKAQSATAFPKGFLCALASLREKIFFAEGTFRAKLVLIVLENPI
jgi:hypothetical protein